MEQEVCRFVEEKTRELLKAPTCCQELKEAGRAWLDAVGTQQEAPQTKAYIAELEADIMPVEQLIAFAQSEDGMRYFGAERATGIAAHAIEIRDAGAKYCDCPACAAAEAILKKRDRLL